MAEIGLEALHCLLQKISISPMANDFYSTYLALILTETFSILTDTMHKAGFQMQVQVLRQVINIVDSGNVTKPLWSGNNNYNSNRDCVKHSVMKLVHTNFPNLHQQTVVDFSNNLFITCQYQEKFEGCLRDFLILTKQEQVAV